MSEEDKAEVRALALDVIRDYRDRGCARPEPLVARADPGDDELARLRGRARRVRADAARGDGARRRRRPPGRLGARRRGRARDVPRRRDRLRRSRACSPASACRRPGIPFTIVEKNAGVGGTWCENTLPRLPGRRRQPLLLLLASSPATTGPSSSPSSPSCRRYFERRDGNATASTPHVRLETEVRRRRVGRRRRPPGRCASARPDGTEETLAARAVISAVGQLNRPAPARHPRPRRLRRARRSTRPAGTTTSTSPGKRVALIGAGASGFQIAPDHRRPRSSTSRSSSAPRSGCSRTRTTTSRSGPGVRWALRHLPFYGRWYRFLLFWPGVRRRARRPPGSTPTTRDQQRAVSEINDLTRQMFTEWIDEPGRRRPRPAGQGRARLPGHRQAHAAGQRQLAAHAHPRRRRPRPRRGIDHIEPDAVVTADGERHEVDVIVYATGFHANRFLWPMEIVGRDGVDAAPSSGASGPTAYLGITVPGFPNLFCMYGPGTNLAHGGSLIFHSECQMRYIIGCLDALRRRRPPLDGARQATCTTTTTSAPRPSSTAWCGRSRRSGTRGSRTPHGEIHVPQPVAPRRLLGLDQARPTWTTSSSAERRRRRSGRYTMPLRWVYCRKP